MLRFIKYRNILWSILLLGILGACSTKKDTWVRRTYHTITSHYNAYYNGETALEEARKTIATGHIDDYTKILDVFPLGTEESVKAVSMQLERAHEKASIVIHKHSMVFNDAEKIKWVWHSYLMIGKSRFYAHNYGLAKQNFKYVVSKYPKENVKFDALLWIARIQVIQEDYEAARGNLGGLQNSMKRENVSQEVKTLFPLVYADLHLKQGNLAAALPYLQNAIKLQRKKENKARYYFIMGQIYQELKRFPEAIEAYQKVLKNNPIYEMDFNARINMAKCYDGHDKNSKNIVNQLLKMVKDEKNKEYLDQIYYALAEVELKNKNVNKAIEYLELSVEKSTVNNLQKAMSSLKLADIYFQKPNYLKAQSYYDSTVIFLPSTYPEYDNLKERKDILTQLVFNLLIIEREDSLQNLANMSPATRNAFINKLIKDEIKREQQKAQEERERQESLQFLEENRRTNQSVTQGKVEKFYFYNPQTLSFGFTEFRRKWGERKLADFWRISAKQTIEFGDEEAFSEAEKEKNDSLKKIQSNKRSPAYYLKDIPLTDALMDSSNRRIAQALYNVGFIYKEKLLNQDKSLEAFESLLKRFPKTKNTPAAYYFLHQIYESKENVTDAKYYKKTLIAEYPETDYAKILKDPDYYKNFMKETERAHKTYAKAYRFYNMKDYKKCLQYANQVITEFPSEKELGAKGDLLKALIVGKAKDTAKFLVALNHVVQEYPMTEASKLSADIIAKLTVTKKQTAKESTPKEQPKKLSIFSYEPETTHMFIVIVDRKKIPSRDVQLELSKHNDKFFASQKLTSSAIPLDKNLIMIGVSNFKNAHEAEVYFKTTKRNAALSQKLSLTNGNYFVISQANYTKLYKTKKVEAYKNFHKSNYFK